MALPAPRGELGLRDGYHSARVEVDVRLNVNESPYPPPPEWLDQLTRELRSVEWNRYPDRAATRLREGIAELHGVQASQVFCANGSNEVLQCLCLAYGGPGRRALTFEPTYALHSHIAELTGTEVHTAEREDDFSLDPGVVSDAVSAVDPDLTFLCSPNNPTGTTDDPSLVRQVVAASPGLVVMDEAYGQFADWSAVEAVNESDPLVVVRTFSKTWSLAALRLGYLIAPSEVVQMMERVCLPYHLDAAKQAAGLLALRHKEAMDATVALLVAERQRLVAALSRLGVQTWPTQSNFILFRPVAVPASEVWSRLVERSILVRDTSSWPGLQGCLRVSVGTPDENDRFIQALTEILP